MGIHVHSDLHSTGSLLWAGCSELYLWDMEVNRHCEVSGLVLAGIELIFSLAAGPSLGFFGWFFLIQDENNVDYTPIFQSLLSCAHPKSRTFQCLLLCQCWAAQEAGKDQGQERWPGQARGIFQSTESHGQYINCGELSGRGWSMPRGRLCINQWVVSNCIGHPSGFIPLSSPSFLFITIPFLIIICLLCFNS